MNRRTYLISAALMAGSIASMAQFSVTLKPSGEKKIVENGTIGQSEAVPTFGGIPMSYISEVTVSGLSQDEAGTTLSIPADAAWQKPAAVLDITSILGENEPEKRNVYSAEYMLDIAGLPCFTTQSLDEALEGSSMIVISSNIKKSTFSAQDIAKMKQFVEDGGIIVAPAMASNIPAEMKGLFGLSAVGDATKKDGRLINWQGAGSGEMAYIDAPEEIATAIGGISTYSLTPSTGKTLAIFDSKPENAVVVRNDLGKGRTYAFGLLWRDVIQRAQLQKSLATGRGKSNTFDPSADMYPLFLRAAFVEANPAASWKFTVPDGYDSIIVPTHDCDSRTAYDEMHYMADYEKSLGFSGHYFLTVHYFRQSPYMSAFYCDETRPAVEALLKDGHTIGSHSICHYPDFGSYKGAELEAHFPLKEYTRDEYAAYTTRDMDSGESFGSTWAELVLSKQILEEDFKIKVRAFRSGHLCVNSLMPEAHKIAGYSFSSCYTAAPVQSQFPFIQRMENDWQGDPTGTLQMPIHFSDVYSSESMDENNYLQKVDGWIEIMGKLKNNYSPAILLIHPNREWKMLAQKKLIDNVDLAECGLYNFVDYGDFWLRRTNFNFSTCYSAAEKKMIVRVNAADIEANHGMGIMIETPSAADAAGNVAIITLVDETGKVHPATIRTVTPTRHLLVI